MKTFLSTILLFLLFECTNQIDFDNIIENEYNKCKNMSPCYINLAKAMSFEWDTMYYFSSVVSLEEINKELDFYKDYNDIGDRVIFVNKGNLVYQKEWFPIPSEPTKGTIFQTDLKSFKIIKSTAVFKITKKEDIFYLELEKAH